MKIEKHDIVDEKVLHSYYVHEEKGQFEFFNNRKNQTFSSQTFFSNSFHKKKCIFNHDRKRTNEGKKNLKKFLN